MLVCCDYLRGLRTAFIGEVSQFASAIGSRAIKKNKLKDNIYPERKIKLFCKVGNIKLSSQSQSFQHLHWSQRQWAEIETSV
jgi:hypothetical protein